METSLTWLGRLVKSPSGPDWQRLTALYSPLVDIWLQRIGVPDSDREDVVQEVLLVVVRRVAEFEHRGAGAFRAWIRGILVNQSRKYFRDRPQFKMIDPEQLADDDSQLAARWDREHDEHYALMALRAVERDFAPVTWQAFCRQVFDLAKPADVAAELSISLNSVMLAKSRVLKRLREELADLVD